MVSQNFEEPKIHTTLEATMDAVPIKPTRRGSLHYNGPCRQTEGETNIQGTETGRYIMSALDGALEITNYSHHSASPSPATDTTPKVPFRRSESEPIGFKPSTFTPPQKGRRRRATPSLLLSSDYKNNNRSLTSLLLKANAAWPKDSSTAPSNTTLKPSFVMKMPSSDMFIETQLQCSLRIMGVPKKVSRNDSLSDETKKTLFGGDPASKAHSFFILPCDFTPPRPSQTKQRKVFANQA